jgi:[protein-PII] uridylyltransferase
LSETATTRDPEDPATIDHVTAHVGNREELELLAALTEADALATSDQAWTSWRARLVRDLVQRVASALDQAPPPMIPEREVDIPEALLARACQVYVEVRAGADGDLVRVIGEDRTGLLADAAAMLALQRLPVRSARVWTLGVQGRAFGVSEWAVDQVDLDVAVLRQRLARIVSGGLDASARLHRTTPGDGELSVVVLPGASARATVLEVRVADRPGLIHAVCAALAGLGIAVVSAHVATVGPRAVDVFYLHDEAGAGLTEERAAEAVRVVRAALG